MNFINNMKLKKRLILSFVIVALLAAAVGGVGYWGINSVEKTQDEIALVRLPSVQSLLVISEAQTAVMTGERGLMINQMNTQELRDAQYNYIDNAFDRAQKAVDVYAPLPQTDEESVLWNQFVPLWEKWVSDNEKVVGLNKEKDQLINSGTDTESIRISNLEDEIYEASLTSRQSFLNAEEVLNQIVTINEEEAVRQYELAEASVKQSILILIVIIALAIVLAVLLGFFISGSISKGVNKVKDM